MDQKHLLAKAAVSAKFRERFECKNFEQEENKQYSKSMQPNNFCRLCAKSFEHTLDNDLFAKNNKCLLQQIKELAGVTLTAMARHKFPRFFCAKCKDDLANAWEFRHQIFRAQKYFKTDAYKQKIGIDSNPTTETELFDTVFLPVKQEYDDDIDIDMKPVVNLESQSIERNIPTDEKEEASDIKPNIANNINTDYEDDIYADPHFEKISHSSCEDQKEQENVAKPNITNESSTDGDDDTEEDPHFEMSPSSSDDFLLKGNEDSDDCLTKNKPKRKKKVKSKPKKPRKPKEKKIKRTGEKLYKCHHCELEFRRPNTRTKHERLLHGRDWPFQCTECGRRFTTHEAGRKHMLVHTKIRNFHCDVCKASFLTKSNLTTHYRSETHKNNEKKLNEQRLNLSLNSTGTTEPPLTYPELMLSTSGADTTVFKIEELLR